MRHVSGTDPSTGNSVVSKGANAKKGTCVSYPTYLENLHGCGCEIVVAAALA
jgi:hypothetical protein